jgi:hypothetical protein
MPKNSNRLCWKALSFSGMTKSSVDPNSAPGTVPMPPSTTAATSRMDSMKV